MDEETMGALAAHLIQYHSHSHSARKHGLVTGGGDPAIVHELRNYQKYVTNDHKPLEALSIIQGMGRIIMQNKARISELRSKIEGGEEAKPYVPEIKELYAQMKAAEHFMERLNA